MARDRGVFNLTIWGDADFRALPMPAQHLYMRLWTHPQLSHCGIVDYRPPKLARFADGFSIEVVETSVECLEARHFVVVDRDSDELLIRSWMRFDGLLRQPRLAVSMTKAYADATSPELRGVVVHELGKIREQEPDLAAWSDRRVQDVLAQPALSAKDLPTPDDPFGDGFGDGFGLWFRDRFGQRLDETQGRVSTGPTPSPSPTPSPTTTTTASRTRRSTSLPDDWQPNDNATAFAAEHHLDLDHEAEQFRNHHGSKGSQFVDWHKAFRTWLGNQAKWNRERASNVRSLPARDAPEPDYWTPPAPSQKILDDPDAYTAYMEAAYADRRASRGS